MKNIKSVKIYKIAIIICYLLLAFANNNVANSDVYDYDYSLGVAFTTSKILGENQAVKTMSPINNVPGGSFNGAMPGIEIKGQYKLDETGDWRLVGGLNYTFYSARERIPRENVLYRLTHEVNIFSPLVGINYTIFRFPSALSSVYAGVEARYNYIHNSEALFNEELKATGESTVINRFSKLNAGRFGGIVKLGLEGELSENYMINVSWGVDMLNALGRDNSRGNLLTPFKAEDLRFVQDAEKVEELTYNFYFSLMIQYRF